MAAPFMFRLLACLLLACSLGGSMAMRNHDEEVSGDVSKAEIAAHNHLSTKTAEEETGTEASIVEAAQEDQERSATVAEAGGEGEDHLGCSGSAPGPFCYCKRGRWHC
mmetsp:Transcript_32344/g.59124  ORF Transcript_32344/g.59124 Transcript_32344/m.59124 type:complete len:108 (+) Transcript_32344:93-416(+)